MSLKAIYGRLAGDSGFSTSVGGRITCEHVPQTGRVYPLVLLEGESDVKRDMTYDGASGTVFERVVVTCMARTLAEARDTIGAAARALLNHQRGTWGGVVVQSCTDDAEDETFDASAELGEQQAVWAYAQTYLCCFEEL